MDKQKNSNTKVTYTNQNICPKIDETKLDKVNGSNIYQIHAYGSADIVKYGVKNAHLKIKADLSKKYQYTWFVRGETEYYISNICDEYGCGEWKMVQSFDQHKNMNFTLTPLNNNYYDKQGMVLVTDTSGNVQPCYTNIYNSLGYSNKITINNTNIYFENNYNYNQDEMIKVIKSVPEYYLPASNIYFLTLDSYLKKKLVKIHVALLIMKI